MVKKKQPPQLSRVNYIKAKARSLPLHKCYINSDWYQFGLTNIIVSRIHSNGNFTFGIFMIDTYKRGLYATTFVFNESKESLNEFKLDIIGKNSQDNIIVEIDYVLAHNIIFKSIIFSKETGYNIPKHFKDSKYILEEDNGKIEAMEIVFGVNEERKKFDLESDYVSRFY